MVLHDFVNLPLNVKFSKQSLSIFARLRLRARLWKLEDLHSIRDCCTARQHTTLYLAVKRNHEAPCLPKNRIYARISLFCSSGASTNGDLFSP